MSEQSPQPGDADDRTVPAGAPPPGSGDGAGDGVRPRIRGVRLGDEIARGGMGVVYRGEQEYLARKVAVKVLAPHLQSDEFVQRFRREARILAGIAHPNIVSCHDAGVTDDGRCFLVMELVDGPTLRRHVDRHGPLPVRDALHLFADLAAALDHAHGKGIIHRDVKPENVLLQRLEDAGSGTRAARRGGLPFVPKLVDLGLAREAAPDGELTAPGTVLGTRSTMAPEQFDDPDRVDHRADVYGLGCVLFHVLTGRPAFGGGTLTETIVKKQEQLGPDPRALNPRVPAALGGLVRRMLARDPADRPAGYAELLGACAELLGRSEAEQEPAVSAAPAAPAVPAGRGARTGLALLALAVLALGMGGLWWWSGDGRGVNGGTPEVGRDGGGPPAPTPAPTLAPIPEPAPEPPPEPAPEPPDGGAGEALTAGTAARGPDGAGEAAVDLFGGAAGAQLADGGWTERGGEGQAARPFALMEPGLVSAQCREGEALCERALPAAFRLTGAIELKPQWGDARAAAAGLVLRFAGRADLVLWLAPQEDGLAIHCGARRDGAWPPEPVPDEHGAPLSLELAGAGTVEFAITAREGRLELLFGGEDRWRRVALPLPAGPGSLAMLVRGGLVRFLDFRLES